MERTIIEPAFASCTKHGQIICGDTFLTRRIKDEGRIISVLADGLGSGVKANVLSSLTASMALKFMEDKMDATETAELIITTLPLCANRKLAYSTFTIADLYDNGFARIIEYDNPPFLLWRQGGYANIPKNSSAFNSGASGIIKENFVHTSTFKIFPGDIIIIYSDGISNAGASKNTNEIFTDTQIRNKISEILKNNASLSSKELAQMILKMALAQEQCLAKDDMTCAVLRYRRARKMLIISGPPRDPKYDKYLAEKVLSFDGKIAICGGTTANIIARELKRQITLDIKTIHSDIPPASKMNGVSLITEGGITLEKLTDFILSGNSEKILGNDAVSQLFNLIFDADLIHFLVGTKINEANLAPELPYEIDIRKNIIRRLASSIEKNLLKETQIQFF